MNKNLKTRIWTIIDTMNILSCACTFRYHNFMLQYLVLTYLYMSTSLQERKWHRNRSEFYGGRVLETGVIIIVKAEAEVERKSAKRGVRTKTCFVLLLLRASAERDCELWSDCEIDCEVKKLEIKTKENSNVSKKWRPRQDNSWNNSSKRKEPRS